jgi:WD40 repeat protein
MSARVLGAALLTAGLAVAFISFTSRVSSESSPEKRYKPELVVQTGHQGFVYDIAFSPNGKIIATGSLDATVKLWDTATGKELRTLIGHTSLVSTLAFSPDGNILASGGVDYVVRTWDVLSGKPLKVLQHANRVTTVAFTPDGKTILSGSEDQTIRAWDTVTGNLLRTYGTEKFFDIDANGSPVARPLAIKSLAIAPDGKSVAISTHDGQIMLLDVQTFATLSSFPTQKTAVNTLAFTPDGKFLTAVSDLSINVFDAGTGAVISAPDLGYASILEKYNAAREVDRDGKPVNPALPIQLMKASLSRDGKLLTAPEQSIQGRNYESRLRVWSIPDGKEVKLSHSEWVPSIQSAAFAPDGATIATGGNLSSGFGVRLSSAADGKEIRAFEGASNEVNGIALSPDGKSIAINDTVRKSMRLIDLTGERHERSIKLEGPSWTPKFRSNDEIAIQNLDLQFYDIKSAQQVRAFPIQLAGSPYAFSADGRFLVTSEQAGLTLTDPKSGLSIRTFQTEKPTNFFGQITALVIDPTSRVVAAVSFSGKVYLFDLASGREMSSSCDANGLLNSIAFSPDGKLFAVSGQWTKVVLCRTDGAAPARTIAESPQLLGLSKSIFSPDGKILATTDFSDTVILFDVESGKELKRFPGSSSPFMAKDNCIEFSPDGRLLYSTSNRNKILVYDVPSGKQIGSLVTFGDSDWAVVTPDGFFDATEGAQHLMHFVVPSEQGYETISLDQLKRYYVPGLLSQIVDGRFRSRQNDFTVTLFPAVNLEQPMPNESTISAELTDRGGGIGRVEVRANGSEVYADARNVQKATDGPSGAKLKIDIPHERLKVGSNSVEVIAWNAEGNVRSVPHIITLDLAANGLITRGASYDSKQAAKKPSEINFYAIISGISDYAGDGLDLRYAAKDAEDITKALSLAARKYFCANEMAEKKPCTRVHIRLLSTKSDKNAQFGGLPDVPDFQRLDPVKTSYTTAFAETAKKAGPDDVVFFYFSGHATSIISDDAVKDSGFADTYVYATRDATTLDRAVLTNRSERERTAVSSLELAEWLSNIKAQKKVLILDTCAAGAAQNDLVAQARSVDALQVRSIDRLQERTGFYVLMGSAADAVSYEANEYRQGLLTYTLLEGMTLSSTLSDGGFLDVEKWFGFSEDKVEDLAKGIGGVQRPSFFKSPTARSFDIGRIESSEVAQIPVARRVPLILQPELREEGKRTDPERLTEKLQSRLIEQSVILTRGQAAAINYVNAANAANGLSPRGSYTINGDVITIELSLIRDEEEVVRIKVSGNRLEIVDKLAQALIAAAAIKK